MQTKTYNSLGLDVPFKVPSSVEEYNTLAKAAEGVNACLSDAVDNTVYRGNLAEFRSLILHGQKEIKDKDGKILVRGLTGVDDETGIPRKSKVVELTSKDEDGKLKTSEIWDESEAVYFKRVNQSLGLDTPEKVKAKWQAKALEVAELITFDPSATEKKTAAPKTPPKKYLEYADKKIAEGKAAALAKKLSKLLGRPVAEDRESLAKAIQEDMQAEAARREASLLSV